MKTISNPTVAAPSSSSLESITWSLRIWSLTVVAGLVISMGLTRSMRGAFIGGSFWIARLDFLGARISQLAAIATLLLLVHLVVSSLRAVSSVILGLGAAFLAAVPAMVLMLAQKAPLPHVHSWFAALCGASAMLLCAQQARGHSVLRWATVWGGVSLLASALASVEFSFGQDSKLISLLAGAQGFFATSTLLLLLITRLWRERRRPLLLSSLSGLAILLAATASATARSDVPTWLGLTGRTLMELAPYSLLGTLAPLAFASTLICVVASLASSSESVAGLSTSLIALGVMLPPTPLVIAWLTLCGFTSVVVPWAISANAKQFQARAKGVPSLTPVLTHF